MWVMPVVLAAMVGVVAGDAEAGAGAWV